MMRLLHGNDSKEGMQFVLDEKLDFGHSYKPRCCLVVVREEQKRFGVTMRPSCMSVTPMARLNQNGSKQQQDPRQKEIETQHTHTPNNKNNNRGNTTAIFCSDLSQSISNHDKR